jgi:hypothetical protein
MCNYTNIPKKNSFFVRLFAGKGEKNQTKKQT